MNYLTLFGAYKINWSYTGKCTYILLKAERCLTRRVINNQM